jgi:hypothetical protein
MVAFLWVNAGGGQLKGKRKGVLFCVYALSWMDDDSQTGPR